MAEELHPGTVGPGAEPTASAPVAPGTLSRLLADLVRAPEAAETPSTGPLPGTVIGRFELKRQLGAGGFGVVWEARDRELDRSVAFKLVRPGAKAQLRGESLRREAEAAARLSHDNIVALHDLGSSEHGPYLVLELLKGQTLAERLAQHPLDPPEALRVFREVVRGVAHAHAEGVVHRDLKPGNVFLCADGRVKVLDFGLAHAFGRRRQSGGTPAYMAPEQWREAPEDERTDVFALGVMLFQLLSGGLPFQDEKETVGPQRAPTLEVPAAPELGALVARMLEKDPVKRPRDAGEVLDAVEAARRTLGGLDPDSASLPVRTRRHPRWRLAGLLAVGAILGVVVAFAIIRLRQAPGRADGRLQVAVADVLNETGERELDVLSGLLVTSLEQSKRLAVMTQARVLDLAAQAGRPGLLRVDETIGREVGRNNGVTTLLLPAIRRLGATYAVEMRAIDPVHDAHLFTVSDRANSKEGLLDLLDRLSEKARLQLKEDPAEVEKSHVALGGAMTKSLEAYQHYVAGIEAKHRSGLWAVALQEQQKAVELDPQFAAAHFQLGRILEYYNFGEVSQHWDIAYQYMDRMPEKERAIIQSWRAMRPDGNRNPAEALRLADLLLARFPDDKFAVYTAGTWLARLDQPVRAEAAFRRVLQLDPGYGNALGQIVGLLQKRPAEYLELSRRGVAVHRSANNLWNLAQALLMTGDEQGAGAVALESLQLNGGQSAEIAGLACGVLEAVDRAPECIPFLEAFETKGLNDWEKFRARSDIATLLAVQGRAREAIEVLRPGSLLFPFEVGHARQAAPEALADFGDFGANKVARREVLAWYGDMAGAAKEDASMLPGERLDRADRWYQALVAAHQGRHEDAARTWADLAMRGQEFQFDGPGWYAVHYLLAEALLAAGKASEAVAGPGTISKRDDDPGDRALNYPRLALTRALALERIGRRAEAQPEVDRLLDTWRQADQDLPLVVLAKAMRSRLATGRPAPFEGLSPGTPFQLPKVTPAEALALAQADVHAIRTAATLAWLAVAQRNAGASEESMRTAREALRLGGGQSPRYELIACKLLRKGGDDGACIPVLRAITERGEPEFKRDAARRELAYLLAVRGRLREAKAWLSELPEERRGDARDLAILLQIGRHRLDAPDAVAQIPRMEPALRRRFYFAFHGKLEEARRVADALPAKEVAEVGADWNVEGLLLSAQGRHLEAAKVFQTLLDQARKGRTLGTSSFTFLLADELLAAGRPADAAAIELTRDELGDLTKHDAAGLFHAAHHPRLVLVRARAMEQLGRRADAVKELDALLAFWKEADADLPLLVEAKAMRARLAAR